MLAWYLPKSECPQPTLLRLCICGLRRTICQCKLKCVAINEDWLLLPQLSLHYTLHTSYLSPLHQRNGWEGSSKQWLPEVSKTSECEKANCTLENGKSTQIHPPLSAQTSRTNKQNNGKSVNINIQKPSPFKNESNFKNMAQGDTWLSGTKRLKKI